MFPLSKNLCLGKRSGQLVFNNCEKYFSTSKLNLARENDNHYSNLEISQDATQNQIKSAYYKLSKLYHPDRNKGSEKDAEKFRQISAAYEILGNIRTRKLYDRGLANVESVYEAPSSSEPRDVNADNLNFENARFHRSRMSKEPSKIYTGRTETYNFDEWTKAHYSKSFQKIRESRDVSFERQFQEKQERLEKEQRDAAAPILLILAALFAYGLLASANNYDDPRLIDASKSKSPKEKGV